MNVMLFAQTLARFDGLVYAQVIRGHHGRSARQGLLQLAIYGGYSSMAALGGASGSRAPRLHGPRMHVVRPLWGETIQSPGGLMDVKLW